MIKLKQKSLSTLFNHNHCYTNNVNNNNINANNNNANNNN